MEKTHLDKKISVYTLIFRKYTVLVIALFLAAGITAQSTGKGPLTQKPIQSVSGSNITIKGKVVDLTSGKGFAGVRISVVNTQITAMTNAEGTFEIKVPESNVTFEVDAPGYQNQVVALKGRDNITIKMLQQTKKLSFYDENNFLAKGSAAITDFSKNSTTINEDITSLLQGQVYGTTHSGTPGSGAAIFVRGLNSLNASAQPLYVVDGVVWQMPQDNSSIHSGFYNDPLSLIDPNDVEKITVLKSGTSMYGSKGGNGVILIDTKRAHSQATDISAFASTGYRTPFKSVSVMKAADYRLYASDIIGGMYDNSTAVDKLKFLDDNPLKSYYNANHNNTDWLSLINKGAFSQNYGISVKGGTDVALMAFSIGYNKSNGNIKNTDFNRFNIRFNSDIKMTDRLKLGLDVAFTQSSNSIRNDGIDSVSAPYFLSLIKSPLYNPYQYNNNGKLSTRLSDIDELRVGNPLSLTDIGIGQSKQYGLNAKVHPEYTFGKDKLMVGFLFSYGWNKLSEGSFVPDGGISEHPLFNDLGEIYAVSRNKVQDRMDAHTSIVLDGYVNWNALRNEQHFLKVNAGYRFYTDNYISHYANGYNTGSDNMTQLTNTTSALRYSSGIDDNWNSMSWYSNADYAFKNRYLLNVSMAMDASSRFGKKADGAVSIGGVPWGTFPSVTGAWLISSEKFMKELVFVDYLKLSAGYGLSGNDNLPGYASRSYFSSVKFRDNAMGLVLTNIGNENLKWETTGMSKVGLDLSMFNNRWNIKAELYSSKTSDLLISKPLNETTGLYNFWNNGGDLQNKGFDISTNVRLLNMRNWKLDIGASIGHYKNEITSLNDGSFVTDVYGAQVLTQVGQSAGVFYGYKTNGVLLTTESAQAANLSRRDNTGKLIPFQAGDMNFKEVLVDNVIDENDRQIIGDPNPDFYGNFNLSLTYKNLSMQALFTYSYGNDVYNALRANLESGKSIYNQSTAMQNRWVANGQVTDIPRATYGDPMGNSRFSDRWIEDGSYLRFKTLSVSYKIPLQLAYLQGISVWGSVNNIYTFTKYLGPDPEFSFGNAVLYQGIDAGLTPQTLSFNLGVNINL
ncbi:MAG: SusC/RagA family TonB-linked outer membrane protein [Paludibacter sp.]|nr:SusC/RagA family TonB-linked outer membrane protein [Paludibacter sp.]